jgi:hypothetical protein
MLLLFQQAILSHPSNLKRNLGRPSNLSPRLHPNPHL